MAEVQDNSTYRINLPQFEGPFDLLLFFIERDEIDIHNIPIATITQEFLAYLKNLKDLNIEVAAEFILVASTLMRIKAKMLLPRPIIDEHGEEVDPRLELVQRLLEYKRYKDILGQLTDLEHAQSEREVRGYTQKETKLFLQSQYPEEELIGMDLYTLMRAFKRVWDRHQDKIQVPIHVIRSYPYTVEEVKNRVLERLLINDRIDFVAFVLEERDRIFVVFSFLAILELVQVQKIAITIGDGFNNFWLEKKTTKEE